jgi:predicted GNAT superfamily acetyltransferase
MSQPENLEKIVTLGDKRFLLKVETSNQAADYAKYEALRNEIWEFPEDNLPGSRNLMCENYLHEGGALFIAAYAESPGGALMDDPARFIGFSYGFIGVKDKEVAFKRADNLQFYSQYTGIKQESRGFGLAIAIKEFQREKVRGLFGISTITCTYDPLTGINAWRNVHYFGMEVAEYRVSTYGEYGGLLNRLDIPSDRFFMSWDLSRDVRRGSSGGESEWPSGEMVISAQDQLIDGRSGPVRVEIIDGLNLGLDAEVLLVRIPRDFYSMLRETDVEEPSVRRIPLEWRLQTRAVLTALLNQGYRVIDFIRTTDEPSRSFYVLRRGVRETSQQ